MPCDLRLCFVSSVVVFCGLYLALCCALCVVCRVSCAVCVVCCMLVLYVVRLVCYVCCVCFVYVVRCVCCGLWVVCVERCASRVVRFIVFVC